MGCPRGCLGRFTRYSVGQIIFLMVAIVPSDPDGALHPSAALLLTRDCFSPSGAGCTTSFFEPMHPNVMQHPFSKTNDHLTPRGCLHMVTGHYLMVSYAPWATTGRKCVCKGSQSHHHKKVCVCVCAQGCCLPSSSHEMCCTS